MSHQSTSQGSSERTRDERNPQQTIEEVLLRLSDQMAQIQEKNERALAEMGKAQEESRQEIENLRKELLASTGRSSKASKALRRKVTPRKLFEQSTRTVELDSSSDDEPRRSDEEEEIEIEEGKEVENPRERDLRAQIHELRSMVSQLPGIRIPTREITLESYDESPFARNISKVRMPQKFITPYMKPYEGTTDPEEHIALFKYKLLTASVAPEAKEACMCKSFGGTLAGPALQWFIHLKKGSIASFAELHREFVEHFASSRKATKRSDDLYSVIQKDDETLRDYVTRFNKERVSVPNCSEETAVIAFRKGLKRGSELMKELVKYPCTTMGEVLSKADAQIKWEIEEASFRPKVSKVTDRNHSNTRVERRRETFDRSNQRFHPHKRTNPYPNNMVAQQSSTLPRRAGPEYALAVHPSEAVMEMRKLGNAVRWPARSKLPIEARDKSKYCEFHAEFGHDTTDCYALRKEIVELLKNGHLTHLLSDKGRNTWLRSRDQKPESSKGKEVAVQPQQPRIERTINCITGGSEISGISKSSAKRHCRELRRPRINLSTELKHEEISFTNEDQEGLVCPHHDALVVSLTVANCFVRRILVDGGSSANILFLNTLRDMGIADSAITKRSTVLVGFSGERSNTVGEVVLPVYLEGLNIQVKFLVVEAASSYNMIIGRPLIHELRAIPSTFHQVMKFPTPWGIRIIRGDQESSRSCYATNFPTVCMQEQPNQNDEKENKPSVEELEEISIDPKDSSRKTFVGAKLNPKMKEELKEFLIQEKGVFAWSHSDMTGIDVTIACHELNVDPTFRPVKQKRRRFAPEKNEAINDEVQKLLKAGSIREVRYPDWLANVVVVKKKNGKNRVCVDYTDLNKACPKDPFPLPHIDRLVDATAGHEMMTFMDAFSGYNQILMKPEDQEKTAFMTNQGIYCYKVMPFGLKNAGSTYQRLVNKMFEDLIGRTMEVYIDDMLVKSAKQGNHLQHLREAFSRLKQYNMKLNPTKCIFGVTSGKFLGYLVTRRGIEADPNQIKAIQEIQPPKTVKEAQRMIGKIAALGRFISRYSEKTAPFFAILKKSGRFEWKTECDEAFDQLKAYLARPPVMSKPEVGETLLMYLSASEHSVSGVLVREEQGRQHPVYYVSRTLLDAETRYPALEKLVLALVMSSRKLRPYFEAHHIKVVSAFPLKTVLSKPELSGRLTKWAIELGGYGVTFETRTAIKSQILADFVADFSPKLHLQAEVEMFAEPEKDLEYWSLAVDGSSNSRGSGAGIVLESPHGVVLERSIHFEFRATNNEAEYEALIAGLQLAISMNIRKLNVQCDSQLIVNQLSGEFQAKGGRITRYYEMAKELATMFEELKVVHVPRDMNAHADALANLAASSGARGTKLVPLLIAAWPATEEKESTGGSVNNMNRSQSWMTPIEDYLQDGKLPSERSEAIKITRRSARFTLIDGQLYKKSFGGPYLKCVEEKKGLDILDDLHSGQCGNHSGPRSLVQRTISLGFYWPTLRRDADEYVRKCDSCQRHSNTNHYHAERLHSNVPSWPFARWGMDIVGKLPKTTGQKEYIILVTDYFTKWVEAEALSKIRDVEVINFLWKNVITRFGVPREITTDNGPQFISQKLRDYCSDLGIKLTYSTPRYPEANGLAESTNKTIVNSLKRRLGVHKSKWLEELPGVLWSYRTSPRTATGETPFSLAYGSEAVAPIELVEGSLRVQQFEEVTNQVQRLTDLELIDEKREAAAKRMALHQLQVARHYNKSIRLRSFVEGDRVLRRVFQNTQETNSGKLGSLWEGPYEVEKVIGNGAYILRTLDGEALSKAWNVKHLKKFHC